jgi:hypothetical protein
MGYGCGQYINAGSANVTFQVTVSTQAIGNGIVFRRKSATEYWYFYDNMGSYVIGPSTSSPYGYIYTSPSNGDVLKVITNGNSIECYLNGVLQWSTSDTTFNDGTGYGIRQYNQSGGAFDDFLVE